MNIKIRFIPLLFISVIVFFGLPEIITAQVDTLSWDYVMNQDWKRPEKLDSFVGIHPRFLLNEERLSVLKSKINNTHKKIWEIVKEKADSYIGTLPPSNFNKQGDMRNAGRGIPWLALAYLLTEDPVYLKNARKWIMTICGYPKWQNNRSLAGGECLFGVAVGYDWLYDELSVEDKSYVRKKLIYQAEQMKNGPPQHHDRWLANHCHVEHSGLAAAGFALYDEVPEAINWIRQSDLVFEQAFKVGSPEGSSDEGHQYWGYSTEALLCYMEAARDLLGKNYYNSKLIKNAANFVISSTIPDFDAENCVMSYGDSHRSYGSHGPTHILYRVASEYNDGYAQWMAEEMLKRDVGRGHYKTWGNLLWYNEQVKPVSISTMPTLWNFDNMGWITTRSGWDEDAVMIGFRCGPMHGHILQQYYEKQVDENWQERHEIAGGHCHPDINSFQIYAYGKWLAIDPGYERPKWTKNHSTILVNEVGQLGEGTTWFDRKSVINAKASSKIIKSESCDDYDYIIGDAGNIYPGSTGLRKFYRHFLYIKPDFIVIVDELKAGHPSKFEWRLNTEAGVEKKSDDYFLVKNGDVVMDTHFILPETITTIIDGNVLRALPERANEALIVIVLHPRKIRAEASAANIVSFKDHILNLDVQVNGQKKNIRLDLEKQKIHLNRDE